MSGLKVVFAGILMGLICLGSVSYAENTGECDSRKGWKEKKDAWMQKIYDEVGVTGEQKAKLAKLREENRAKTVALREKMKEARLRLYGELKKEKLDMKEVYVIVDILKSASSELVEKRVDNFLDMREVLTTEQFGKLLDLKSSSRGKWRETS